MLTAVLVTHLHSDHITDLNDVITTHWVMSPAPTPLRIYGPPRMQEVVDGDCSRCSARTSSTASPTTTDLTEGPMVEVDRGEARRRVRARRRRP